MNLRLTALNVTLAGARRLESGLESAAGLVNTIDRKRAAHHLTKGVELARKSGMHRELSSNAWAPPEVN